MPQYEKPTDIGIETDDENKIKIKTKQKKRWKWWNFNSDFSNLIITNPTNGISRIRKE